MSEKQLLKKLKSVGNPFVLLKMMNDSRSFVSSHQTGFPKNDDQAIYIQVDDEFYKFYNTKIRHHKAVTAGNYIFVSEKALNQVKKIILLDSEATLSDVLLQIRKVKYIKQYKVLFQAMNEDFKTNLKMTDLVNLAIELSKRK